MHKETINYEKNVYFMSKLWVLRQNHLRAKSHSLKVLCKTLIYKYPNLYYYIYVINFSIINLIFRCYLFIYFVYPYICLVLSCNLYEGFTFKYIYIYEHIYIYMLIRYNSTIKLKIEAKMKTP